MIAGSQSVAEYLQFLHVDSPQIETTLLPTDDIYHTPFIAEPLSIAPIPTSQPSNIHTTLNTSSITNTLPFPSIPIAPNTTPALPIQISRTVSTIQRFAALSDNWDGDGAVAITNHTIVNAIRFIQGMWAALPNISRPHFAPPDVGPSSFDEIGFEWEVPGRYLSVIVCSSSEIEVYWRRTVFGTGQTIEKTISSDRRKAYMAVARIFEAIFVK
ncbi:MAG: hypothetical protein F4Z40_02015 [Chloroflexi bacterium]|nr:hypothetical protein [Chloroflexota bacterium]